MTPAKTLAKALARYIGDDAVLSFQDGPKMQGQFVVVQVPRNSPIGQLEIRYKNELGGLDVLEQLSTLRQVMFTVDAVRDGTQTAADRAEELRIKVHSSAARQELLGFGLALTSVSEVRDLTAPGVNAAAEPRFGFDVFYAAVQTIEEVVLSIESIDINARYRGMFTPTDAIIEVRKP
jgi:hypothetical protein